MQMKFVLAMAGMLALAGCQQSPVGNIVNPAANPVTTAIQSVSTETCKATFESYFQALTQNPEKYRNIHNYPELMQYSETLDRCMEKGYLTQLEMMKAVERVSAAAEGRTPDEARVEQAMKALEAMDTMQNLSYESLPDEAQ